MILRKLYLKLKRKLFYLFKGFYPEDYQKLVNCQKYLDNFYRENISYKDYLSLLVKDSGIENKCDN